MTDFFQILYIYSYHQNLQYGTICYDHDFHSRLQEHEERNCGVVCHVMEIKAETGLVIVWQIFLICTFALFLDS